MNSADLAPVSGVKNRDVHMCKSQQTKARSTAPSMLADMGESDAVGQDVVSQVNIGIFIGKNLSIDFTLVGQIC